MVLVAAAGALRVESGGRFGSRLFHRRKTHVSGERMTWEEAVQWYREQPDSAQAIRDNYFDLPVRAAAERYAASEEFREIQRLLGPGAGRAILDVGAGNGVASYAFARAGWRVTALEPDPSGEVGADAIEQLANETGVNIRIVREVGEQLPFQDGEFAAIHA